MNDNPGAVVRTRACPSRSETHEVVDEVLQKMKNERWVNSYTISDTSSVRLRLPPSPTGEGLKTDAPTLHFQDKIGVFSTQSRTPTVGSTVFAASGRQKSAGEAKFWRFFSTYAIYLQIINNLFTQIIVLILDTGGKMVYIIGTRVSTPHGQVLKSTERK